MNLPVFSSLAAAIAATFALTFVTVMMPGPIMVGASRFCIAQGARAAIKFLAAVITLDVVVFVLMSFGLQPFLKSFSATTWLLPFAGFVIIGLGTVMVRSSFNGPKSIGNSVLDRLDHPVLAGILAPAASPGYWIWWVTVGAAVITMASQWGKLGFVTILSAYLAGVVAWYGPLVLLLRKGRQLLPQHLVRRTVIILGLIMITFGLALLVRAIMPAIS